jgi:alcohol dehydrogenase
MRNVSIWTGMGDLRHMAEIRDLITAGTIDPTPIYTDRIALDDAVAMYARMASGDTSIIKVLVTP